MDLTAGQVIKEDLKALLFFKVITPHKNLSIWLIIKQRICSRRKHPKWLMTYLVIPLTLNSFNQYLAIEMNIPFMIRRLQKRLLLLSSIQTQSKPISKPQPWTIKSCKQVIQVQRNCLWKRCSKTSRSICTPRTRLIMRNKTCLLLAPWSPTHNWGVAGKPTSKSLNHPSGRVRFAKHTPTKGPRANAHWFSSARRGPLSDKSAQVLRRKTP